MAFNLIACLRATKWIKRAHTTISMKHFNEMALALYSLRKVCHPVMMTGEMGEIEERQSNSKCWKDDNKNKVETLANQV